MLLLYLVVHRWFLMLPEADHTSTSSAKVKKEWTNTSAPPYVCMVCTVTTFLHFFFIIKPTRCTNFTNLFWHETLHVSDSLSGHHQQFIHCTLSNGICYTGLKTAYHEGQDWTAVPSWSSLKAVYKPVWHIPLLSVQWINSWWWTDELSETCRVSWQNNLWN